jgi:hypothetical protein
MLASRRRDAPPAVRQHHLDCRGQDADPTTMSPSSTSSTHSWAGVLWDLVHVLLAGSCPASSPSRSARWIPMFCPARANRWGRTARAARRRASAQSPRAVRPAVRSARPTRVARASQPVRRQRHARPDVGQLSDMLAVTRPHSEYPPDRVHICTGREYISKKCPRGDLNPHRGGTSPNRGSITTPK